MENYARHRKEMSIYVQHLSLSLSLPVSPHTYVEEDLEDGRVGVREQDDGEEGADAAVEHGGPDVGHRVLGPLVAAP